jgi:putative ABC transport system permease protein
MLTLLQDFRFSVRQLIKSPSFAFTSVVSLALGIGATTAVFSVVYAILMNPFPYTGADRMGHMRLIDSAGRDSYFGLTGYQWQQLRRSPVLDDAFISDDWNLTVTGHDMPEDLNGVYVTSNTFNYMGVPPVLGRGIQPSDAVDGQDPQPVVVLGYKFWQRHFAGDPAVLGQTLQLVRNNYTIVGVAAPRFTWDDGDVYLPLKVTADPSKSYYVGLRLKSGVSREAASAALQPLIDQFAKETPKHFPSQHLKLQIVGLNDQFVHDLGGTLYLLLSSVALLLAIGCGNVSILMLARGTARQHEFAVRAAVGASRSRVVRQLLTEALLLSLTGAALGVLLAYKSLGVIVSMLPQYSFPHEASIQVNLPVLLFSVATALLTGILFGLWPALELSRPQLSQIIQSTSRKIAGGVRGRVTNDLLIAGQIAFTLLLLAGAGAAMEGFLKLLKTPLGYDPHNVMSVGIPIHQGTYKTWAERTAYFDQILKKAAAVPGVKMAAISSNATPPSNGSNANIEILGSASQEERKIRMNYVNPQYFPILRIPVAQGRIWDETENHNAAPVVVINETLARRYFPNGDALGHSIRMPDFKDDPPYTLAAASGTEWKQIIGVIPDKRDDGLRNPILPEAFVPDAVLLRMFTQILIKSDVPPLTLLHAIGLQVSTVDPDQQITGNVRDLDHWITDQQEWQQEHLVAWLFGSFAMLALVLAAVGLYSVVSYSVAQRTSEFGIRMALGAPRAHVLKIVFASTVLSVGGGIVAGVLLTLSLNKVLAQWATGSSRDPLILLGVTMLLSAVAAIACAGPARKASGVDPMVALRYE